jgi:pimeloyl-ACP methyl ester carboxylesterase
MIPTARTRGVQCLSPAGFHTMRYREWGDPNNPRVVVCVHGLTRCARDFDRLAAALAGQARVVCPDVAGRGDSDWLAAGAAYGVPQYAADMVNLIARLDAPEVDWVGTSMGGLIGMALAGQARSPIRRLVLNDVGPRIEWDSLARIASYVGKPAPLPDFDAAVAYVKRVSAPFALRSEQDWREITESVIRPDGAGGWRLHYDPRIGEAFAALTPEAAAAGEAATWTLYDRITAPTLLMRGSESDLLSRATADEMGRRGPRARLAEIPGVGHAPMLMDEMQIDLVRRFLSEA